MAKDWFRGNGRERWEFLSSKLFHHLKGQVSTAAVTLHTAPYLECRLGISEDLAFGKPKQRETDGASSASGC